MKIFKELIPSLTKSYRLRRKNLSQLINNKMDDVPVIVSLTSFGDRLSKVDIAIRSILNQTHLPEKIVLNINLSYRDKVTTNLKKLESDFLEINYVDQQCPHMKLIPTLKRFPNKTIITVDDDAIYPKDLIEKLYLEHINFPEKIIANYTRVIGYDEEGKLKPYKTWKFNSFSTNPKLYLPIGVGGVLFPPNVFNNEVFIKDKYMNLCPKADDLWFKMMALKNEKEVKPLTHKPDNIYPIIGTQANSLKSENVVKDRNTTQWEALIDHYNLTL